MKLYHVITGLEIGGAEMMLYKLLAEMNQDIFKNTVVSLTKNGPIGNKIKALGIPVKTLNMNRQIPNPMAIFKLIRWIRRDRPDAMQTWMYHSDLIGGIASKLAGGPPVAWSILNGNLDPDCTRITTRWAASVSARLSGWIPTRIVSVSEASKKYHCDIGYDIEKMRVIPMGFDISIPPSREESRSHLCKKLGIDQKSIVIGLVARWHAVKDHQTFFSAARLITQNHPAVQFVLCGSGITWDNRDLVQYIDINGVRANTHLMGEVDDIPRLNVAMDIATNSSVVEAFPNTVGEAMVNGVPCVVTNVGDSPIIVGETGRIVESRNSEALASGWASLMNLQKEERIALGAKARERIKNRFSIDKVVASYANMYNEMINTKTFSK